MARVPAEDIRQVETVIDGRLYKAHKGFFEMPDRDAKVHLKSAEYSGSWSPLRGGTARRRLGYRCGSCGYGSFFVECSRCHGSCVKEV